MSETIDSLVSRKNVIAVICNQWGDTGKGKFSDYFAKNWADVIARGTGGNNAGHTVVLNGEERVFHLLPSGIVYDKDGKINILGKGMVIDMKVLCSELSELDEKGLSYKNLMISECAHVIMPYHIERDKRKHQSQANGGIGSTGRGIGPCYEDKIGRRGIRMLDLFDSFGKFNEDKLVKKINKSREYYPDVKLDVEKILEEIKPYAEKIKQYICDADGKIHSCMAQGKKILLEGAQGLLLSIDHGTYPYVTSSDCSLNGTANGVGLCAKAVDLPLGIVKYPFMTRVGAGPFPSELGGRRSEEYCANPNNTLLTELENYGISYTSENGKIKYEPHDAKILELIHSKDDFEKGIGIRLAAKEYGATTGRPRRIGWTDAVALKYAIRYNGPKVILTKVDVFAGLGGYNLVLGYDGGDKFSSDADELSKVNVNLSRQGGFSEDISKMKNYNDLPQQLRQSIAVLERISGGNVKIVSVGPEAHQTIIK